MGELSGLVEKQILHDDALHRRHGGTDVVRVRIGLHEVLALHVHALERAIEGGLEHVRDAQARLGLQRHAPVGLEARAHGGIGDVAVGGELVREGTHVAGPLHVVLAAQRAHAHPLATQVAGGHGEIGVAITVVVPWLCSVTPSP